METLPNRSPSVAQGPSGGVSGGGSGMSGGVAGGVSGGVPGGVSGGVPGTSGAESPTSVRGSTPEKPTNGKATARPPARSSEAIGGTVFPPYGFLFPSYDLGLHVDHNPATISIRRVTAMPVGREPNPVWSERFYRR